MTKSPIDAAEAWVIMHPGETIGSTADRFGLSVHSVRARISHKYGSLAEARRSGYQDKSTPRKITRSCLRCKKQHYMDRSRRMCDTCRDAIAGIHDGYV